MFTNKSIPFYTKNKDTKKPSDNPSTDEKSLNVLELKDKSGFITKLLDIRGLNQLYNN